MCEQNDQEETITSSATIRGPECQSHTPIARVRLIRCTVVSTSNGKPRYYFGLADNDQGEPVLELPSGFKISESVNGVVSLVKERPSLIQAEEMAVIEEVMDEHPQATRYRFVVKKIGSRSTRVQSPISMLC